MTATGKTATGKAVIDKIPILREVQLGYRMQRKWADDMLSWYLLPYDEPAMPDAKAYSLGRDLYVSTHMQRCALAEAHKEKKKYSQPSIFK
jgi:hypothetical protein